ncbi:uncharacterized protein LOC125821014 [Solanum verrucosum]|uniref:uncharacterized protein LOC125821014 n=1 Tax=Solanum verrucosum TaxID=315347 RepID=UPI0020D06A31|nr:uncharacterized protein LOC125821014 [Solanum verrucosum]
MREDETIVKYSDKIPFIVNKTRLLGEDFKDGRIVEKILLTISERFESKISSLEECKDLSIISVEELISALQAQEQRRAFRQDNVTEGAFNAQNRKEKVDWIEAGCMKQCSLKYMLRVSNLLCNLFGLTLIEILKFDARVKII